MTRQRRKTPARGRKTAQKIKLESLSVAELRRVAGSLTRIPLTKQEIASVRRKRLIDAIKTVMDMD